MEAEQGLAELILEEKRYGDDNGKRICLDDWLCWWAGIVAPVGGASYNDIPFWLKILPRIFFLAINSSANGIISKKELGSFYASVVGLDFKRISKSLDIAYNSMTSVNTVLFIIITVVVSFLFVERSKGGFCLFALSEWRLSVRLAAVSTRVRQFSFRSGPIRSRGTLSRHDGHLYNPGQ